jgi:hypothetical protein
MPRRHANTYGTEHAHHVTEAAHQLERLTRRGIY